MPLNSTFGAASSRGFGAFRPAVSAASFIAATGGTITTSGNYKYHTFTSSGTFEVTAAPSGKTVDCIIVAGGGSDRGGGGGYVYKTGRAVGLGSYGATVGAGGDFRLGSGSGDNSTFLGFTAIGGGGTGLAGGSGGGGRSSDESGGGAALQPTSASGGLGFAGSSGTSGVEGAGGGAGGEGNGETGGPGRASDFGGATVYAAGGNGSAGSAGSANTGDGGDLGEYGGSGIIIVRYLYQ